MTPPARPRKCLCRKADPGVTEKLPKSTETSEVCGRAVREGVHRGRSCAGLENHVAARRAQALFGKCFGGNSTMLKCPFCQYDNEDGALFCEQCKSDLSGVEST